MTARTLTRKEPVQARSRARVDTILKIATAMIEEEGSDGLKMNDLARRAGIPIGSLYQFFPNKQSIIHTLADIWMQRIHEQMRKKFADVQSLDDARAKTINATRDYYELFLNEPVVRDIWCSTQSDKQLQMMDIEDSRRNGELFFEALAPFIDTEKHEQLSAMCFLCMQLTGAAVRLAIMQDKDEAELIMAQYDKLSLAALKDFE